MKKCIVIGGGAAGLSTAAYLSSNGIKVTILESSPKAGGRAYSFSDPISGNVIDNGQHILMGCYKDTLNFIKLIGAKDNFVSNKSLRINFLQRGGKVTNLIAVPYLYPINILIALLKYDAIPVKDRISILKFMVKIPFTSHQKLVGKSVNDWLSESNQNEAVIKSLWEIITVGALNTNIKKASALIFRDILMKIFFYGNFASTIVLPKYDLTRSYIEPALEFIKAKEGVISFSSPVEEIITTNNNITAVKTNNEVLTDFDFIISAIPYHSTIKLFPDLFEENMLEFEYSTIVNIHIWLNENNFKEEFYGLINSPVHWVFNKGSHLNLVISDADYLIEESSWEIYDLCLNELKLFMNIHEENIVRYKIIKEKRATFIPSSKIHFARPSSKTKYKNLFLAGDWTDTGLPSTLESAVKSGRIAAENVINS